MRAENAILDGEIACVDDSVRSAFNDLFFRRRECVFFALDLLARTDGAIRRPPGFE